MEVPTEEASAEEIAPTGVEPMGVEPTGVESTGVEPTGVEPTGVEPTGEEPMGEEPTEEEKSRTTRQGQSLRSSRTVHEGVMAKKSAPKTHDSTLQCATKDGTATGIIRAAEAVPKKKEARTA